MWLLAIKALLADRGKLLTSLVGVTFSVVLINMQGGIYLGLMQKASQLVDYGQADIWVGHRLMNNVEIGTTIPHRWIDRIRSVEGVERAEPYLIAWGGATLPNGGYENVEVVGCEEASLLGNAWVMEQGNARAIRDTNAVLIDVYETEKFGGCGIGDTIEINGRQARIVGMTRGILGFTPSPFVFTTLQRARSQYCKVPPGHCSYFLVKAKPGTNIDELVERIRDRIPGADVYDRDTYSRISVNYWLTRTPIGISFGLATLLGLLVGLIMVGQTLHASVNERIKEFATLKAMGADADRVSHFLIAQALGNAVFGSAIGLAVSFVIGLYGSTPRHPIMLTWWVMGGSVVLITMVCLAASWLPYWRVSRIDPAHVLRN